MSVPNLVECAVSSCRRQFESHRRDARYCSAACRAQASRERQDVGARSAGQPARPTKIATGRGVPDPQDQAAVRGRSFATAPLRRSVDAGDVQALRREVAALVEQLKGLRRDHEELSEMRSSGDQHQDERMFAFQEKMDDSLRDIRAAVRKVSKGRADPNAWCGSTVDPAIAEHESAILDLSRRIDRLSERLEGLIQAILKDTED